MARRKRNNQKCDYDNRTTGTKAVNAKRPFNDVAWYARNDKLLRDAASLSFANAVGGKLDLDLLSTDSITMTADPYMEAIPGICSIYFVPTIGQSTDNSSAVNIAARDIYAFVRHANSGSANYDSPDLMMYLLAMDDIYLEWNLCKRAYGLMLQYSQYDRYLPAGLVEACGFDPVDLQNNLANFRYGLNAIAAKINALYVPNVMSFFIRHSWMVSNVWKDSDNDKAQMYAFVPAVDYVLKEQGATPGLSLDATVWPGVRRMTVAGALAGLNRAVAAVIESEDMNIMAGDLRKAYGPEKAFMLSGIDESYAVTPVYNEEVLNQIHNLRCLGNPSGAIDVTINNNTNAIVYDPTITDPYNERFHGVMLNMPWNDVTPANVMVGSRLTPGWSTSSGFFYGTEFCTNMYIYQYATSASNWTMVTSQAFGTGLWVPATAATAALEQLYAHIRVSQFDWHPLIWISENNASTGAVKVKAIMGDIDNYTMVSADTLKKLHDTALLSEFGVPINGTI